MDSTQFETLTNRISGHVTRRRSLALFGVLGVTSVGVAHDAAAKKKHHRKKGHKGNSNSGGDTGTTPPPPPPSVEEQLVDLINAHRQQKGASPLTWQDQVGAAAQAHSDDMTDHGFVSTEGSDGTHVKDWLTKAGYQASTVGVTVFQSDPGDPSAQAPFATWSKPANDPFLLLTAVNQIGVGQATNRAGITRWTLILTAPKT